MKPAEAIAKNSLTNKELQDEFGVRSVRSVNRIRKEFGLMPVGFVGYMPIFSRDDVARVKAARVAKRTHAYAMRPHRRGKSGIYSVKELRRRANRGKAKR